VMVLQVRGHAGDFFRAAPSLHGDPLRVALVGGDSHLGGWSVWLFPLAEGAEDVATQCSRAVIARQCCSVRWYLIERLLGARSRPDSAGFHPRPPSRWRLLLPLC